MRARWRRFKTMWEQIFDNSHIFPILLCLNWWLSKHGVETLNNCSTVWFAHSQNLSTQVFTWPNISKRPNDCLASYFYQPNNFQQLQRRFVIRTSFRFLKHTSIRFEFTLSTSQLNTVKKLCRLFQVNQFQQFHSHWIEVFFQTIFMSSTCTFKKKKTN